MSTLKSDNRKHIALKLLRPCANSLIPSTETKKTSIATCTLDCGGKCPLAVTIVNGVIREIRSYNDGVEPPLNACVRGLNYHYRVYAPDRLKYPLIRVGERGSGRFRRISWEQAITQVAGNIASTIKSYGPEAILDCGYAGSSMGLAHRTFIGYISKLLNRLGGRTAFGTATSEEGAYWASRFTYGIRTGADINSMEDLVNSKLIILWGMNPVENRWGTDTLYWLLKAKKQGIKIICVDPCLTDTVRTLGADWIPVRPSTDTAMLVAMAYVMITEKLYDKKYVDKFVFGFDNYCEYVLGKNDGIPKTPQWASGITSVPAEKIIWLAREYVTNKPAALIQGFAPGRTANGEQFHRAAIALQAMTGNIGISGGSGSCDAIRYRQGLPRNPIRAVGSDSILRYGGKGVEIKPARWAEAVLKGKAGGYPSDIKMIYVSGHNILTGRQNVWKGIQAFKKVDYVVCQDQFMTPTARYADIVLPVITNLERNDIAIPWCHGDYTIFSNKVVEPLWTAKSDREIAQALAKKLEIADFETDTEDELLQGFFEKSEVSKYISYAQFKKQGLFRMPGEPVIAFKEQIENPVVNPFPTPSGKIEIYSQSLEQTNFNVGHYSSVIPDYKDIPRIPMFIECDELPLSPRAKIYPLQLITPHHSHRAHSEFFNIPKLRNMYRHEVWIHPNDAQSRGIRDGDVVHIFNDLGVIAIFAKVTDRTMPGVIRCYEGGWFTPDEKGVDRGGCGNVLINDMLTSPAGASNFNTCLVDVK